MATQETIKQIVQGGVPRDIEDVTARTLVQSLQNALDTLTNGDTTSAIESFNEIISFLENIEDSSTLSGIIAGIQTSIAGKVDKVTGKGLSTNDFTTELMNKLIGIAAGATANQGTVTGIKVNNGNTQEPTDGVVNLEIETGGEDGVGIASAIQTTTSEVSGGDNVVTITLTDGTTYNITIKNGTQGAQGNSGVASADGVIVVNNVTEGGTSVIEGGVTKVKVLSAEMGKDLATKAIPTKGTFAEAYSKARVTNVTFPWFLSDTDTNGNAVNKIIWHIGDKRFVDGIGAEIDGVRDGVTIRATGSGKIKYRGRTKPNSGDAVWGELPFTKGINNYSFAEIAEAVKTADSAVSDAYDGSTFNAIDFEFDSQNTTIDIDFGNQKFVGYDRPININQVMLGNNVLNRITAIRRLVTTGCRFDKIIASSYANPDTSIKYLQLSGDTLATTFYPVPNMTGLTYINMSGFDITGVTSLSGFAGTDNVNLPAITVDIRTWDTSNITDFSMFMLRRKNAIFIIGNFSTASATNTTNFFNITSGVTVVCTSDTPPDLSFDWITTHVSSIRIPNRTVTVDGNDVEVLSLYQNHVQNDGDEVGESGWSKYKSIMTTYEEGEY